MKTTTLPSVRVAGELRAAVDAVLGEGETLSAFLLESVQLNIGRREFIARGLRARDQARASGEYVDGDEMLARLDATLTKRRLLGGRCQRRAHPHPDRRRCLPDACSPRSRG